jgi:amino-acid N-acetyltransferase
MDGSRLTLRPAGDEIRYVESVLERNGLPARNVRSKSECFYVGCDGEERVGVGGIEPRGDAGLLRSLVVERPDRGHGYGTAICAALEAEARTNGIEELYLLTTSASGFFAARGYVEIERGDVPSAIRGTAQFDDLCPATATCMRKSL